MSNCRNTAYCLLSKMNCNLAEIICRKHEDAIFRIAIEEIRDSGSNTYTFGGLDYLSDKFATALRNCGIKQGDVAAIILPPSAAFVVAHFGALKLGAIVAPFSAEFNIGSLHSLIKKSQANVIIIGEALFNECEKLFVDSQDLSLFIASDYVSRNDFGDKGKGFWYEINFADADFKIAETDETAPAYIFFEQDENSQLTSAIFSHGLLVESLRKNESRYDFDCDKETPVRTTNDWSSRNVLLNLLHPSWFFGFAVEASVQIFEKDKGLP